MMRPALLVLISVVLSVVAAEGISRGLGYGHDFLGLSVVEDGRYGHRIGSTEMTDDWGFRNQKVPARADVVAIGDSQTYGVSADAKGSWPAQLGGLLHRTTYNLGLGGYGPVQYGLLWDDYVARLDPAVVVVGLYLGNDVRDAFTYSSLLPKADPLRPSNPPSLPIVSEVSVDRPFDGLRQFLYLHSVLYNMAKVAFPRVADNLALLVRPRSVSRPEMGMAFQTVDRLDGLRLDRQENVEGLRITLGYVEHLAEKCRKTGRRCLIAVIPTKESVLQARIRSSGLADSSFEALWATEVHVRALVLAAAERHGVQTVDVLPALASAATSAELYPALDGHPNRIGYGIIATEVAKAISGDFALPPRMTTPILVSAPKKLDK